MHAQPDMMQQNVVDERALGILREKTIAQMEDLDVVNVPRDKLGTRAMFFSRHHLKA